ncbi:MAG: phage major capsid protein [Alphaproteobacteria bacterium]
MLESTKIARRQSEIRQALAELSAKEQPADDDLDKMSSLDTEYRQNETRYRAALIAEDNERRDAGQELETRAGREWQEIVRKYELRQVALALDEGRPLSGQTAEIVTELRNAGGYRGVPVPWEALEQRAGETVATDTPAPRVTRPIIDRLFPQSAAARMGASMVNIGAGEAEYPVATQGATASWQANETGDVGSPQAFQTTDRPLKPDHTLGVQMKITRRAIKQSGAALEQAVRRDMASTIGVEMDRVIFLGSGSNGEPTGVIAGASGYGITETAVDAAPTYAAFRKALVRFMTNNAIASPAGVRVMVRPETWDHLEDQAASTAAPMWEWDRLAAAIGAGNITLSTIGLAAPTGSAAAAKALLTTATNGVAPIYVGTWGAVDLIRDPYSDAASGALRLTALATMDVTVARAVQLEILTGLQEPA